MNFPKHQYVRSKPLMLACRKIPCQSCGADDGSVCGAHSNQSIHGKSRGLKSSDIYVASLCFECHYSVDQGRNMSRSERVDLWTKAHYKTVRELVRLGLWPVGVAVPELEMVDA